MDALETHKGHIERMERERGILRDAVIRAIYAKGLPPETEKLLRAALESCGVF